MIFCEHVPAEPLAQFVDRLWFFEGLQPLQPREHVLPDGTFELIIDLRDEPQRLFDRENARRDQVFRGGWVSGAQTRYIIIDALPGASMIGAHFKAGGAAAILGLPADALRDRVVQLEALWGAAAAELREQLLAARGARGKFAVLEGFLLQRLARHRRDAVQLQRVFWARDQFVQNGTCASVGAVVEQLGVSHKHFIAEFRRHVGLTPKLFCRIQRFQQTLAEVAAQREVRWTEVALSCGYFDQSHFVHDFQQFSGFNPTAYARERPEYANFVPVPAER